MFIKPVNDFPREKQDEAQLEYLSLADSHSSGTRQFPSTARWWSVIFALASLLDQSKSRPHLRPTQRATSVSYVITFQ